LQRDEYLLQVAGNSEGGSIVNAYCHQLPVKSALADADVAHGSPNPKGAISWRTAIFTAMLSQSPLLSGKYGLSE